MDSAGMLPRGDLCTLVKMCARHGNARKPTARIPCLTAIETVRRVLSRATAKSLAREIGVQFTALARAQCAAPLWSALRSRFKLTWNRRRDPRQKHEWPQTKSGPLECRVQICILESHDQTKSQEGQANLEFGDFGSGESNSFSVQRKLPMIGAFALRK
jgi:hypothetical protein